MRLAVQATTPLFFIWFQKTKYPDGQLTIPIPIRRAPTIIVFKRFIGGYIFGAYIGRGAVSGLRGLRPQKIQKM